MNATHTASILSELGNVIAHTDGCQSSAGLSMNQYYVVSFLRFSICFSYKSISTQWLVLIIIQLSCLSLIFRPLPFPVVCLFYLLVQLHNGNICSNVHAQNNKSWCIIICLYPFSLNVFEQKASRHLTISPSHHLPDAKVDKVAIMSVEKAEVSTKRISGDRVSYQNGQKRKDFNSDNLANLKSYSSNNALLAYVILRICIAKKKALADALDILACDIEANECCYAQPTLPLKKLTRITELFKVEAWVKSVIERQCDAFAKAIVMIRTFAYGNGQIKLIVPKHDYYKRWEQEDNNQQKQNMLPDCIARD
ncbi:hypothetical protein BD560DRAFT_429210 [Blakeslea trispora]|nr:hypothetical protein BD560DRAFT_429210 [Blakeslea trispora]